MTNQEINERIAKLCGWKPRAFCAGYYRDGFEGYALALPNYAESLDACREFMSQIHGLNREEFVIIARSLERLDTLYGFEEQWALITLTPLELCEAFLRLKGQWE
jgi:hypothetical protein